MEQTKSPTNINYPKDNKENNTNDTKGDLNALNNNITTMLQDSKHRNNKTSEKIEQMDKDLDRDYKKLEEQLIVLSSALEKKRQKIVQLKEKNKDWQDKIQSLQQEIQSLQQEIQSLQQEIQSLQQEKDAEILKLSNEIVELNVGNSDTLNELKAQQQRIEEENSALRIESQSKTTIINWLKSNINWLESNINLLESNNFKLTKELEKNKKELEKNKKLVTELKQDNKNLTNTINDLNNKLSAINSKEITTKDELNEAQNQLKEIKNELDKSLEWTNTITLTNDKRSISDRIKQLKTSEAQLVQEVVGLENNLIWLSEEKNLIEKQLSDTKTQFKQSQVKFKIASTTLQEKTIQVSDLKEAQINLNKLLKEQQKLLEKIKGQNSTLDIDIKQKISEISNLKLELNESNDSNKVLKEKSTLLEKQIILLKEQNKSWNLYQKLDNQFDKETLIILDKLKNKKYKDEEGRQKLFKQIEKYL